MNCKVQNQMEELLTPRTFDLKANPATLTVEAQTSKHRKNIVLSLHPDLVAMLTVWLPEFVSGEKLFPKLEKNKAWFMVKKDLERIDIPYKNEDGIADFHATGRHTYNTGLLTNGTSVVDAMKLSRHSDVRTTKRYTHIGLDMQAVTSPHEQYPNGFVSVKCISTPDYIMAFNTRTSSNATPLIDSIGS